MVSHQAARLVADSPSIAVAHFRAEADPYHPDHNPDGYLNLGTAENRLMWDLLEPAVTAPRTLRAEDMRYAPLHGSAPLRAATAELLSLTWRVPVDPDDLIVVSGATAALDIAATVLCDPGEAIVVPAPYYSAFDTDLTGRSGARIVPAPMAADQGFRLDASAIDAAITAARGQGTVVRAITLASPCNPTGRVHTAAELRAVMAVAQRHGADVIADEIYANSVFGRESFVSMLDPEVRGGVRTHAVWGFAKDFGLSGLKVGVLHTSDPRTRAAAQALAYFAPVSTDTQALLCGLLADHAWAHGFLRQNRHRLGESYRAAAELCAAQGIPHAPAAAGFSLWLDLSSWLPAPGFAEERLLWERIFDKTRVNILPGREFACPEPGWFRLCHVTEPDLVREGITRIGELLRSIETVPAADTRSS